jgi:CheY-like chemotaxis protein
VLKAFFQPLETVADMGKALSPPKGVEVADCIVAELDGSPGEVLEKLKPTDGTPAPVILYIQSELAAEDERRVRLAVFNGLARVARTPEQLVDEVVSRIHEPLGKVSEPVRAKLAEVGRDKLLLSGRKILVIDDDIRNIFSLTSALEEYDIDLLYAESGRAGIDLLKANPDVDVALVDIMMPDMDGYETMREMRSMAQFSELPLVAVTAKAMKGDRQKCLQAGATDYVSKPVDVDHLISVLRVSVQRSDSNRTLRPTELSALPAAE